MEVAGKKDLSRNNCYELGGTGGKLDMMLGVGVKTIILMTFII